MRRYILASKKDRREVDLRDYADIITRAVMEVMPEAKVKVHEKDYTVSPTPRQGQAIRIGRKISRSPLGGYCVTVPKLFNSEEIEDESIRKKVKDGTTITRVGGHQ